MKIDKLLTIKEVINIVGLKKSTIYHFINKGKFPKQIKIGHLSRWRLSDIQDWIDNQQSK
ncbi:MAG: AlpA family phage regulatory protein [Nautiliaceae bacterium]